MFYVFLTSLLRDGYRTLFEHGIVTYLEIAADFKGVAVQDLFVFDDTLINTNIIPAHPKPTQTIYIGHRKHSRRRFCIYDKASQLQKLRIMTDGDWTRIESRLRYTGLHTFELNQLANPFLSLRVCSQIHALQLFSSKSWRDFTLECERSGAHAALQKFSPARKKQHMGYLNRAACKWWIPHAFWGLWEPALTVVSPRAEFAI